jgi:prepilin-type N-terminal cleavage/methylation domain-containing protein
MPDFQRGFSLVELIIAIALIGILALVAAPFFQQHIVNSNLKTAIRDIAADFAYLKEKAISEGIQYRITIDTGTKSYTIQSGTASGSPWTTIRTKYVTFFGKDIYFTANTTLTSAVFQTRGTVTNGTVELANSRGSTVRMTVNITGRTYIEYRSMQ